MRTSRAILTGSAVLLLLAGCGAPSTSTSPTAAPPSETSSEAPPSAAPDPAAADLKVADSALGQIIVDANGMTVYYYDPDVPDSGVSTCADSCLAAWPSVHPAGAEPVVDGISAAVGIITGTDGLPQLTVGGRPVYLYVSDTAPGDVVGQAAGGVWWVVAPDGARITG